jgi:hypothetical protein
MWCDRPKSGVNATAAPATVCGERDAKGHWETGKAAKRNDP